MDERARQNSASATDIANGQFYSMIAEAIRPATTLDIRRRRRA
jgi:hypothetical protein